MTEREADLNMWISVLDMLEAAGFIRVTSRGCYTLVDSERTQPSAAAQGQ